MVNYLITGVNRGIGLALVQRLCQNPENFIYGTVRDLTNLPDGLKVDNVRLIQLDMKDPLEKFTLALQPIDNIDVVIANAGRANNNTFESTIDADAHEYEELYQINVVGNLKLYQATYDKLFTTQGVTVKKYIAITSLVAQRKFMMQYGSGFGAYGVSKTGLNYLVKQISLELTKHDDDIVNQAKIIALHPGQLNTTAKTQHLNDTIMPGFFKPVESGVDNILKVLAKSDLISGEVYNAVDGTISTDE